MKLKIFIGLGILLSLVLNCGSQQTAKTFSFNVAFLKGEAERSGATAKLKTFDTIPESETVTTAKDAILDLASDLGTMRMLGSTNVKLSQVSADHLEFDVSDGNILVKAAKLNKGQTLRVSTPTVVAAVRGTEFWGQVNKESELGTFAVRDGAVEIMRKADGVAILIEKGQALDIDPKAKEWKVRPAKQGELDAMSQIDQMK